MKRTSTLFLLVVGFFIPMFVFAHAEGASFEKTVDGVLIDVGYAPEEFVADSSMRLDFLLSREESGEEIDFTDIWVRISEKSENERGKTFLATGVAKARYGTTGMVYAFPEAGEYTISARFQDADGDTIAEADFPVSVEAGNESNSSGGGLFQTIGIGVVGILIGMGGILVFRKWYAVYFANTQ